MQSIGIFDSGLGGLTVYKELKRLLPNEKFIYFGDTARVPYGSKSPDTIRKYAFEISYFLAQKKIKLMVVACNTASSVALNELKNAFRFPVIGVVQAAVETASSMEHISKIGVIGTKGTIKSKTYQNLLIEKLMNVSVFSKPCPIFVPIIEEGLIDSIIMKTTMDYYLKSFLNKKLDAIILGCTHYPIIEEQIFNFFNKKVKTINPGKAVAEEVKRILSKNAIENTENAGNIQDEFFLSDKQENFKKIAKNFLGFSISRVNIVKNSII